MIRDGFNKALAGKRRARRRRHGDVDEFPTGLAKLCGDLVLTPERIFDPEPANHCPQVRIGWQTTNRPSGLSPPQQTPKGTVPANDGFRPHDGDRLEHRAEDACSEREDDPISGTKAGHWHGTMQDDELLAKDDIFREEGGAGLED